MNIDYELLDKQVGQLLIIRFENHLLNTDQKSAIDGVIELIEALQDEKDKK